MVVCDLLMVVSGLLMVLCDLLMVVCDLLMVVCDLLTVKDWVLLIQERCTRIFSSFVCNKYMPLGVKQQPSINYHLFVITPTN